MYKILISAAEASSDAHGAELLLALKRELGEQNIHAFGVGGPKLQAAGLDAVVDARELLAMGFVEVIRHLPKIFLALKTVSGASQSHKPDLAVMIDYPDFHFRLAKRLKAQGIPLVYYIPPKVWVWRKGRLRFLKKYFNKILCIFPFEEPYYESVDIPAVYVGNPLMDELPLRMTREEARRHLSLKEQDSVLVLMPGSRASELKYHLELMLEASVHVAQSLRGQRVLSQGETLKVLMPFPMTAQEEQYQSTVAGFQELWKTLIDVRVSRGNAHECLVAADAGLIKSGTSTLEAGLLGCPHAIVYKPSRSTAWIFKNLIRYSGPVGLVNLVYGAKPHEPYLVSEILCEHATVENLAREVTDLMLNQNKRTKMLEGFAILKKRVQGHSSHLSPSVRAAQEVIQVMKKGP